MKANLILISIFLYSLNLTCQNESSFHNEKWSNERKLVFEFAQRIISKKDTINRINYVKSDSLELVYNLRKFEIEIESSKEIIDYYIHKTVLKSRDKFFSIHFFTKENEEQFSKIYLKFKNNGDNSKEVTIEEIKIDSNKTIEKMKEEWKNQMGNDIPPPPLPPSNNN